MLELLNIHFTFYGRTSHCNKEGKSLIPLKVSFRSERRDLFTGLYCLKQDQDSSAGKVTRTDKLASSLNQNLAIILHSARQSFDEMRFSREAFTIDELVNKIKGKESSPTLLLDYLKEGNRKMLKRVGTEIIRPTYNK